MSLMIMSDALSCMVSSSIVLLLLLLLLSSVSVIDHVPVFVSVVFHVVSSRVHDQMGLLSFVKGMPHHPNHPPADGGTIALCCVL